MTRANYSSSHELDFRLMWEDSEPPGARADITSHDPSIDSSLCTDQPHPLAQQPVSYPPLDFQWPTGSGGAEFSCPSIQITSSPAGGFAESLPAYQHEAGAGSVLPRQQLFLPGDWPWREALSPCSSVSSRSCLSDASSCDSFSHLYDDVEAELNEAAARVRLASPRPSPLPSPQVSPFGSPAATCGEDPWFQYQQQPHQQQLQHPLSAHSLLHQSPCQSPCNSVTDETWWGSRPSPTSSRPSSPCGKRPHSSAEVMPRSASPHLSPGPSPSHSPRGSVTEETWLGSPASILAPMFADEADVPSKTRRTNQLPVLAAEAGPAARGWGMEAEPAACVADALIQEDVVEHFLSVPTHYSWTKPTCTHLPIYSVSSLPLLDYPLPSRFGQYELRVEAEPRAHHRAHYETEGSRGAVRSANGGHPVVKLIGYAEGPVSLQVFIGTMDERSVRPHPFYQVHRITGKTVTTASLEAYVSSTKTLQIQLTPEDNMAASIDCLGILKLRNADIELQKGEVAVGRKNTRVRIVFRVHIPQPDGNMLSLQTVSTPIECSQRSVLELPQIECFLPTSGWVTGGQEMHLTGPNLSLGSKVIFMEKGPDGRTQWEIDARLVPEKSTDMSIVVMTPAYHTLAGSSPAHVLLYVSNGKKRRSAAHSFTYLPVQVKQEATGSSDYTFPPDARLHLQPPLHPERSALTAPPLSSTLRCPVWEASSHPAPLLLPAAVPGPAGAPPVGLEVSVKQELGEDLQEVTLDDVSEIIGRDLFQCPGPIRP